MFGSTTNNSYALTSQPAFGGFLATVKLVFADEKTLSLNKLDTEKDSIITYNDNGNFYKDANPIFLGAVEFSVPESAITIHGIAYPFDKNMLTYPIIGETIVVLQIKNNYYWLPYTKTIYPNYRENWLISESTKEREPSTTNAKKREYETVKTTGTPNQKPVQQTSKKSEYAVKETIHYLKPKQGDTIITGRVGQTIRFSEFFLSSDDKTSSPSIFIRNKQSSELDTKPIGELVEEDINKDGSSIYITSNKVKIPFKEVVEKKKIAFKDYPSSEKLEGNQIYINSDRVLISSKSQELILFGAKNTGVITDGRFSIDAANGVYAHSENDDIVLHTINGKNVFINSDSSGKIYLGKNKGEGDAGADVQKMVLGGELISILEQILDAINQQTFLTPSGPTAVGPTNSPTFNSIKNKLKTILSARNYLSKQ
jgi:hypothetical protein